LGSDATHRSRAAARGAGGNALMLKLARDPRPFVPAKAETQFLMDSRFRGNERSMRTQRKLKTAGGAFTLHQTPLTSPHHTHHRRPCPMTISMFKSSVPIFVQFLTSLSAVLDKAAAYAEAKKVEPSVLLNMRLAPDMFPLLRQVRAATDHAINACGRLA